MARDHSKAISEILGARPKDYVQGPDGSPGDGAEALHAIAEELIEAIHAKDAAGVASCLKAAFQECESEPHEEGPHEED